MCGHHHDTEPRLHITHRTMPIRRSRRAFLGEFGRGTLAMAVLAPIVAACGGSDESTTSTTDASGSASTGSDQASPSTSGTTTGSEPEAGDEAGTGDGATTDGALTWARADLGFVSAYVLARGNRAAIVDTGVDGSADAIGQTLASIGLTYDDVDHVILTHKHGDHAGSIAEVTARAAAATVYAGQADLDEIDAEAIVGLAGGEDVFGLEMLATPGHTEGHVSVIDHTTGLLVAGDAIFVEDGQAIEGPAQFFDDIPRSRDTIRQLAELSFNTLLVGHGAPIEGGADAAVAALAASLP